VRWLFESLSLMQRSAGKGIDRYGILDIGNRLGVHGTE
jgi:hypothetical protein